MLTECLPASPAASEDPVRDLANDSMEESPSRDWMGHHTAYEAQMSKQRDSFGGSAQREQLRFKKDMGLTQGLSLLLTVTEVRVLSSLEAQELSRTSGVVHTLTISPQTKEVSEVELGVRPLLVLFGEEKTVRQAYRLLYSLLESSKPIPKPRMKSSLHSGQHSSLVEALRRGMETGERTLMLQQSTDSNMMPEERQGSVNAPVEYNVSTTSVDSQPGRTRTAEDVRRSTYIRLDSLEETIRELENTLIEISGHAAVEQLYTDTTIDSAPAQTSGRPTSETKRPAVPPKPSSLSPASNQVHCLHLLCKIPALKSSMLCFVSSLPLSSLGGCWNFAFKPLVSAP